MVALLLFVFFAPAKSPVPRAVAAAAVLAALAPLTPVSLPCTPFPLQDTRFRRHRPRS